MARGDAKFSLDSISHFDKSGANESCDFSLHSLRAKGDVDERWDHPVEAGGCVVLHHG